MLKDTFAKANLPAEIEVYAGAHGWCPPDSRVYNEPDIVPKVPPLYSQLGSGIEVDTKLLSQIKHSIVCYHSLASYLLALNPQSQYALASECVAGT